MKAPGFTSDFLSSDFLVSNFAFKLLNLYRYITEGMATGKPQSMTTKGPQDCNIFAIIGGAGAPTEE